MNVEAAAAYAERYALQALLVLQGEHLITERYAGGFSADQAHALYSGTKSFWGVAAVAAESDGLIDLDEPVAAILPAWGSDAAKRGVTLRQLLQMTSGIGFGGLGNAVPTFERAIAVALKTAPGERFTYSGIPLQVFGAALQTKLGRAPHDYLRERILDPIGLRVGKWRTLGDGTQPLPTGAFLAASEWLKFGRLVLERGAWQGHEIVNSAALGRCFAGSEANSRYGLAWWLSPLPAHPDIAYASGSGGQALYVLPAQDAVVVKFGDSASYKHDTFLKRLLDG